MNQKLKSPISQFEATGRVFDDLLLMCVAKSGREMKLLPVGAFWVSSIEATLQQQQLLQQRQRQKQNTVEKNIETAQIITKIKFSMPKKVQMHIFIYKREKKNLPLELVCPGTITMAMDHWYVIALTFLISKGLHKNSKNWIIITIYTFQHNDTL